MVKCKQCGELIDEPANTPLDQRSPCPSCGSKTHFYEQQLAGEVTFHKKLQFKARHGQVGEVKPFLQLQTGDDLYRKTGEWNHREKMEDRENDLYIEHIVNPETGAVIHHCEEPLSRHQGHGSAKKQECLTTHAVAYRK